jgi:hypothetical protein
MVPALFREELRALEREYGPEALRRVTQFLSVGADSRHKRSPLQRMATHVFPDLKPHGWMHVNHYPEISAAAMAFKSHHTEIREEILRRSEEGVGYYEVRGGPPIEEWRSVYLKRSGVYDNDEAARFPITMAVLERHTKSIQYALGEVHFSILDPGAHIPKHSDPANFFVSFHYTVLVPPSCAISVGGEARMIEEGVAYLFDHSVEHEAWNRSTTRRIHLLFDVWHPDLSPAERDALTGCFRKLLAVVHS